MERRPACGCRTIKYVAIKNDNGTFRDQWICTSCETVFIKEPASNVVNPLLGDSLRDCSQELPNDANDYLLYSDEDGFMVGHLWEGEWTVDKYNCFKITHWMDLTTLRIKGENYG